MEGSSPEDLSVGPSVINRRGGLSILTSLRNEKICTKDKVLLWRSNKTGILISKNY